MAAKLPSFSMEISSFSDENSRYSSKILSQYFNHGVTLILPGENSVPQSIRQCFSETFSYKLKQLPVSRLLEVPFTRAFVKTGSIHLLSSGTKLGHHDCCAVTPTGCLLLHLTKDTYQELGLDAIPQTHSQKKSDSYLVKIDLRARHFLPGKKGYNKVFSRLERLDMKFDFFLSWVPHIAEVCSSSVAVYFSDLCECVERIEPRHTSRVLTSLPCPRICASDPYGGNTGCNFLEIFEWMGSLACQVAVPSDSAADKYASSFESPEPSLNCPRCCVFQVSGFLPPSVIVKLLNILQERQSLSSTPHLAASMTVHGYKDSPVLHKCTPHDVYMSGSNLFSFVLLPESDNFWFYTAAVV